MATDLQTTYDLYGVVNHHGALGAGHYTAYCKSPTTSRFVGGLRLSLRPIIVRAGQLALFQRSRGL
jgi:Ubiquitin carboxyl-terminal hydrolase